MIKFSKEKVLLLHQLMAEATGGSVGVRDEGLLDSALEGAFAGFGDEEFYPTKEEKGARLGYTLISNHASGMHLLNMVNIIQGFQRFDNFGMGFIFFQHFAADGNGYGID